MKAFLGALFIVAALAGCFGDEADEPAPTTTPPPLPGPVVSRGLVALSTQKLTADGTGFEPSVEVAMDGTIYVTAAQGVTLPFPSTSRLWVSSDNGSTFAEVQAADPSTGVSNLPFGAEGDLAVNAKNHVYYVDLTLASTTVTRSTDGGKTWEFRNPAAFAAGGGDREWVAAGPEDVVAVTWNNLAGLASDTDEAGDGLWVAVSTDGGLTFPVQTPVEAAGQSSAGGIDMGADGTILVGRSPGPILGFVSRDGGVTFERTVVKADPSATYLFAFPAIDANGTMYMTWIEEQEGTSQAFYSYNAGGNWSEPVRVSHHGGATVMAHIDAAEKGHIAIAYACAPGVAGTPDEADGEWHVCAADIHAADTASPRIDLGQLTDKPVKSGFVCTGGLSCEEGRELGDYLQTAIGPDGGVHVAWSDEQRQVYWAVAG